MARPIRAKKTTPRTRNFSIHLLERISCGADFGYSGMMFSLVGFSEQLRGGYLHRAIFYFGNLTEGVQGGVG